jgi:hypothetical protein
MLTDQDLNALKFTYNPEFELGFYCIECRYYYKNMCKIIGHINPEIDDYNINNYYTYLEYCNKLMMK